MRCNNVSIHTPTKGVTRPWYRQAHCPSCFNPHTHEGCDLIIATNKNRCSSFNPHTHEGCDTNSLNIRYTAILVSIHTPTKGVTRQRLILFQILFRFQSTHPRRVWPCNRLTLIKPKQFQSTHPRRVWLEQLHKQLYQAGVSIHTPTKGVTPNMFACRPDIVFQSTHPRRVWLMSQRLLCCTLSFNPHTHEGCDTPYLSGR